MLSFSDVKLITELTITVRMTPQLITVCLNDQTVTVNVVFHDYIRFNNVQ